MLPRLITVSTQQVGGKLLSQWGKLFVDHMLTIDKDFDPGHKIDHVMRVTKTAVEIAIQEGADLAVVLPAAILHDTRPVGKFDKDRSQASALSASNSMRLLTAWGYPAEYHDAIKHAILAHSFSAAISADTLEAKVVQDADRLDALGNIGVARAMAVGFKHGNPLYNVSEPFPGKRKPDDQTNILDHFYLKLFLLPESLHTLAARSEAARRIHSMETFLQGLADEVGVNYVSYQDYSRARKSNLLCAGTLGLSTTEALAPVVKAGYRYYDTATGYQGSLTALAGAMHGMDRTEFNICTKINDGDLLKNDFSIRKILESVLQELNTHYLDTLMLHSPALLLHDHAVEVFEELIKLKEEGLIKHIGVSSFNVEDLERLDPQYRKHIEFNEVELNPLCQQKELVKYCVKNKIEVMAERPFGKGDELLENPVLKEIAAAHQASVQQVILAWLTQNYLVAIPITNSNQELEANKAACEIYLSHHEMNSIAKLDLQRPTIDWKKFAKIKYHETYAKKPLLRPTTSDVGIFGNTAPTGGGVQPISAPQLGKL